MSAIIIGDPHFQVTNIPEVNLFISRVLNLIKEKQPTFCVILGDVLHTHERLHTIAMNKAYEFIRRVRDLVKTYVLVGNHDALNNQIYLNDNHWMNGMKEWENVTIVDKVKIETIQGFKFVFCPYVPNGRFIEALDTAKEKWTDASCIFAHQEFKGCSMNAITSIEGDEWKEDYPQVISGHIHNKQKVGKNIYYPGSAMQHAFGESSKNIIAYVEFEKNKKYTLVEIDLKLPRKKTVHLDMEDIDDYKEVETKDKVKISITGNYEQFKAFKKTKKYKELIKKGRKVVFKPKKIEIQTKSQVIDETESDFTKILQKLIGEQDDPYLLEVYNQVVDKN